MAADDAYGTVQAVARPDYPASIDHAWANVQVRAQQDNSLREKSAAFGTVQTQALPGSPEMLYYWNGSSYVHAPRWRWSGTAWVEVI